MRLQGKEAVYESGCRPSPDVKSVSVLILDFPASKAVRNEFLLFTSHSGYGLMGLIQAQTSVSMSGCSITSRVLHTLPPVLVLLVLLILDTCPLHLQLAPALESPVSSPEAFILAHLWLAPRISFQASLTPLATQEHSELFQAHNSPGKGVFSNCTTLPLTSCSHLWGYLFLDGQAKRKHKGLLYPPRFPKCQVQGFIHLLNRPHTLIDHTWFSKCGHRCWG